MTYSREEVAVHTEEFLNKGGLVKVYSSSGALKDLKGRPILVDKYDKPVSVGDEFYRSGICKMEKIVFPCNEYPDGKVFYTTEIAYQLHGNPPEAIGMRFINLGLKDGQVIPLTRSKLSYTRR